MNLRRKLIPKSEDLEYKLLEKHPKRLSSKVIQYLEERVPLRKGEIFNDIRYDGMDTREELLLLFTEKIISLRILQLEIGRRRKIQRA